MNWIGFIIVAPIWGILSTRLFLQIWLTLINAGIHVIGLIKGKADRQYNVMGFGFSLILCVLWSGLLYFGQYLLSTLWGFGYTTLENIVYWVFAITSLLFFVRQFPYKIRRVWRQATVPGALEQDIYERQVGK